MRLSADLHALDAWVDAAQTASITYFRVRRSLFEQLSEVLVRAEEVPRESRVTIDYETFVACRSFLQCRNDALTDDKRLSFDKAVSDISRLIAAAVGRGGTPRSTPQTTPATTPAPSEQGGGPL